MIDIQDDRKYMTVSGRIISLGSLVVGEHHWCDEVCLWFDRGGTPNTSDLEARYKYQVVRELSPLDLG